jgi:hypothetical protein
VRCGPEQACQLHPSNSLEQTTHDAGAVIALGALDTVATQMANTTASVASLVRAAISTAESSPGSTVLTSSARGIGARACDVTSLAAAVALDVGVTSASAAATATTVAVAAATGVPAAAAFSGGSWWVFGAVTRLVC